MLPAAHRLRSSTEFSAVVRRGRRASRPLLTVHLLAAPTADPSEAPGTPVPVRAGLVVSKAVGNSVVRHRTARRLRHLLAAHLERLGEATPGAGLVVRAAPSAGDADSTALGHDLDRALDRLCGAAT